MLISTHAVAQKLPSRAKLTNGLKRPGVVMIEFAIVLPVILFSFACMIEISRVLLLQHTADTAAYEGARNAWSQVPHRRTPPPRRTNC